MFSPCVVEGPGACGAGAFPFNGSLFWRTHVSFSRRACVGWRQFDVDAVIYTYTCRDLYLLKWVPLARILRKTDVVGSMPSPEHEKGSIV